MLNSERLTRRTFLRGTGTTLALPILEAMCPRTAGADDIVKSPPRLGFFYFGTGMNMRAFTPVDDGKHFTPSRVLQPLMKFRNDLTVLSGTYLRYGGSHTGDYTFLTGTKAHTAQGIRNTISADQLAAAHLGRETRFPSLQLSISRGTGLGGSMKTLSWNARGMPLPAESDPSVLFSRLFLNEAEGAREKQRTLRRQGSILDSLKDQAARLNRQISKSDRKRIDQYLTSVREVEQQLQRNILWSDRPKPTVDGTTRSKYRRPFDPEQTRDFHYETYSRLMYELIALAWQTDSTRVISYVVRQELRGGVYPEFGVSKGYHELSHHNNDPRSLDELARVDVLYMRQWAQFLEMLQSIKEPDGRTLLDRSLLGFSSGMGFNHSPDRLPTVLCGGRALGVAHQGHLRLPERTPLSNLWRTMLDRAGVPVNDAFQDSQGSIRELLA
ncbi:hypothetical protein Pan241w_53430 [Gimesia alba]|uniref:DUF1552 domain-containing protein n=1 Tax=Gimesia alba TaxID=2527973 RepID=A0A517RMY9_9PLAN|nr:DUF1552 domain-containing protein [Gimesia alba]QDT45224.1 hypothetical protein Pan241w_53430 [Gimesia alba]